MFDLLGRFVEPEDAAAALAGEAVEVAGDKVAFRQPRPEDVMRFIGHS